MATGVSNQQETGVNIAGRLADELPSSNLLGDKRETNAIDEYHHYESLDVDKLENSLSSKLQLNDSNEVDLNEYCLLEIFSYLSLDDMIQVKKVCKKWYQVSQQWYKQIQSLVCTFNRKDNLDASFKVHEKYYKRIIYKGTESKKLLSMLYLYGYHIKYYTLEYYEDAIDNSNDDELEKLIFQWVPKLCKNIVDFKFCGRVNISTRSNFENMATHWEKLEKITMVYRRFLNGTAIEDLTGPFAKSNLLGLDVVPMRMRRSAIRNMELNDKRHQLNYFIPASKNFTLLKSLELRRLCCLTDDVVAAIVDIKSLTHLSLCIISTYESDKTLDPIANMKGLKLLKLVGHGHLHEDSLINIIQGCTQLEQLFLVADTNNWLTNRGMTAISKLKKLKYLEINSSRVSNISIISACSNLEVLWCRYLVIDDSDVIELLKNATNLKFLSFFNCNITKDILQAANKIANERKNNILCITVSYFHWLDNIDPENIDTPYFKYFRGSTKISMEIFPKDIRSHIQSSGKLY